MERNFAACSATFSNGVTVVNATPHDLNLLSPEGEKVIVKTSVPKGEKSGFAVINARAVEKSVGDFLVDTEFCPCAEGNAIIEEIKEFFRDADHLFIVGSMIAANAYSDVYGLCPAPGFERVPPAEKLMCCDKFTRGKA